MCISVVIPVYNAGDFLEDAVISACSIDEVSQVILVEDNSPDQSLQVCKQLVQQYSSKVELYTHSLNATKGAGATRNLGISKARCEFLAFLDADDYYLPNRFLQALKIFSQKPFLDYVVSPSQLEPNYLSNNYKYCYMHVAANNKQHNLFSSLLTERFGYFDTNSILIRRASLLKLSHLFNPDLALHQDSELWLRIAYSLKGYTENETLPGSVVRRHGKNRIVHRNAQSLSIYWNTVASEFEKVKMDKQLKVFIECKQKQYVKVINNYSTRTS